MMEVEKEAVMVNGGSAQSIEGLASSVSYI